MHFYSTVNRKLWTHQFPLNSPFDQIIFAKYSPNIEIVSNSHDEIKFHGFIYIYTFHCGLVWWNFRQMYINMITNYRARSKNLPFMFTVAKCSTHRMDWAVFVYLYVMKTTRSLVRTVSALGSFQTKSVGGGAVDEFESHKIMILLVCVRVIWKEQEQYKFSTCLHICEGRWVVSSNDNAA